jgi:hypothetical protein
MALCVIPQHEFDGVGIEIILGLQVRLIELPDIVHDKDDRSD